MHKNQNYYLAYERKRSSVLNDTKNIRISKDFSKENFENTKTEAN